MKLNIALETLDKIQIHFIVARARTGSTLLNTMLGQHDNVVSISEQQFAYFLYPKYHKIKQWSEKTIDTYCEDFFLFSRYGLSYQFSDKATLKNTLIKFQKELNYDRAIRLTSLCFIPNKDKSKITTIVFKELIMGNYLSNAIKIFPQSKFIFLQRNPLDNVARVKNQNEKQGKKDLNVLRIAIDWNYSFAMIKRKLVGLNKEQMIVLQYEQLILNAEDKLRQICAFFHLSYDEKMLNYTEKAKEMIPKDNKVLDPKFRMSNEVFLKLHEGIFKKPNKEKIDLWKKELTLNEANMIWGICGKLAQKLNYEKDTIIKDVKLPIKYYIYLLKHAVKEKIIVQVWYASPYFIKRSIKQFKIKFGLR